MVPSITIRPSKKRNFAFNKAIQAFNKNEWHLQVPFLCPSPLTNTGRALHHIYTL
ncbi:hypothetical protein L541_1443 [Bordetella hinzii CA90 BAL1384]|uniref:Uncharacterized protein n=1 Tax=Bordetella hinzii OH87 BAL007II TaxID=1331262 RepID=A0ABR4R0V5_9BORD|nr:hypothetical protein L544_3973 [Bordetella hinzii OH87 BAL007II]KCB27239.1 hypothetical protein L541_1443 [Bordetella hinzii CA90 BAL1384]KCB31051.1 hypothetical protein L543_3963 [Bordetella hinzii L60]KCB45632.1 hypothetical protein L539_4030 [Bordetella hinzii 5132]KCB52026.1 hypothetical protein L537_3912 [Bordetella hinzii 1277]